MRVRPSPGRRRGQAARGRASGEATAPGTVIDRAPATLPEPVATPRHGGHAWPRGAWARVARRLPWAWLALAAIAAVALALRLYGLNWDANNHLHPDEREIVFRAMCLSFPGQAALRPGNCDAAATGPGWFFSPASPLNPHFFAYGSFPLYLLAAVCHALAWLTHITGGRFVPADGGAWDDFNHFTLVGRTLSALFDTASVVVVGLLGRRLGGVWTGLLAAALVAVIPFEIQVAHFYAVDTVLTFFVLLTLLACVRLVLGPGAAPGDERTSMRGAWSAWRGGLFIGAALGLAVASKVSALPLLLPAGLALVLRWRRRGRDEALLAGLGVLSAAILAFIITSPYTLIDWHNFQLQVNEQTALSRGQLDYPYVRQFANTTPYLYQIQQMLLYDMGLALGLLGLLGAVWAGWRVWRRWDDVWLPLVAWVVVYFAIIGGAYTKFTRYMLPLFPVLALCGAAALVTLALAGQRWLSSPMALSPSRPDGEPDASAPFRAVLGQWRGVREGARAAAEWLTALYGARWWRLAIGAVGLAVLASTAFMGLALDNIYSAPNTRVQASVWIYDHVAPGSSVTNEVWDDPLPIQVPAAHPGSGLGTTAAGHVIDPGAYIPVPLNLYDSDTPQKADQLAQQLASADVVVISSQRLVGSIPKLPDRYPMTTRYYQLLFAGKLGFKLAARFEDAPHLLGVTFPDSGADESFSVYDHPPVWIFVRQGAPPAVATLRAALTQGIYLPAESSRSGSQKSLLLTPQAVAADAQSAPLGMQFPTTSLPNRIPLAWWLLLVELLGLVSFPLAYLAFPGLRDRGWGLSKLLGLLVVAYLVWLPASLTVLPFTSATVAGAFALVALAGAAVTWWKRDELWSFVRQRWRLLAVCEGGFLAAFGFFTWVRALDPDLWHIWRGGEKPMELGFLDGMLRSRYMPPVDVFFSGGHINYYYYGQFLTAVLVRLTGIAPTTAFNLMIPLLFGLAFTAAFSVVGGLTGRWWAGLAGGVALVVVSNLDGLWQALGQWHALLAHQSVPPFDYWASSRVIPYTINEFPYWSFLYADLHAHVIDLPVVVFVIAASASLLVRRDDGWRATLPTLAVVALALGATAPINTWDFPAFGLVVAVVLVVRELTAGGGSASWRAVRARLGWPLLRRLVALLVLTVGAAYALYLPWYAHYQVVFSSGIGPVATPTNPGQFVTLFAIWLFLVASFFALEIRDRWEASVAAHDWPALTTAGQRVWLVGGGTLLVLVIAFALGVKALLGVLLLVGLTLALNPRHPPIKLLTYILVLLGLAIALGVEFIYVRDFLDNGLYERMNTVFKFYYQVWMCFALGGGLIFAQVAPRVFTAAQHAVESAGTAARAWSAGFDSTVLVRIGWVLVLVTLLAGSLVFDVEGTAVRVQDPLVWAQVQAPPGGLQRQGLSLDGMAYMRGWYPGDYAAIIWMNAHIGGIPTVMEASSGPYQWQGRVAVYTGLPDVLQNIHEAEQRYPDEVYARQNDVQLFYTTVDPQVALDILHHYGVRFVYVGSLERNCPTQNGPDCVAAPAAAVRKYQTMVDQGVLAPIYQNGDVTIYEVVR